MLHLSLFLFFSGLVVFLCNVNLTIFKLVLSWVSLCTALYGCITVIPVFRHDSPYHTPLSLPVWHFVTGIAFLTFRALERITSSFDYFSSETYRRFRGLAEHYGKSLVRGMQKIAEETALKSPSEVDTRAFIWTFDCLDEDHELEHFFSSLPGFRSSKVVEDPLPSLTEEVKWKLYEVLRGLSDRTFSSNLPSPVQDRRAIICVKAIDPEYMPDAFHIIDAILFRYQYRGPVAIEIAEVLRGWGKNLDEDHILNAQFVIYKIITRQQPHDDSWFTLASDVLAIPEASLRHYATYGDSLSLVILIHIVRQQFIHFRKQSGRGYAFPSVLEQASNFDVRDTSLGLQHDFCALWNQVVHKAQEDDDKAMAFYILGQIRNVFLALHQDTGSAPTQFSASTGHYSDILRQPSSYPACNVPGHPSDPTPHIHDDPYDRNITAFVPSLTSPDPPSSSTRAPLATRSDLASSPEYHPSILATAAEGEGGAMAGLSMEMDASYSPLAIREEITATADLPPQLPSPPPVTD